MSKRLKEVFAEMLHVSFLEIIEPDPCEMCGTMDIIVEEQHEDGSAWARGVTRHVKVCHSQEQCMHYEIPTDPATGKGKITLTGIQAVQYTVVQVDECGKQMINNDEYNIQYHIEGRKQEEDYATLYYTSDPSTHHQCVRLVNRGLASSELELYKVIRNQEGDCVPCTADMEFLVRVSNENCFEKFVKLNHQNHFHEILCDLRPGFYTIEECEYSTYAASYTLNFGSETCDTFFDLASGHNELRVINTQRSDTQLTLTKYMRDGSGSLCKPQCFEEFEVRVIGGNQDRVVCLHEGNDFCVTLYGLDPGYYDVSEVSCDSPYEVSYRVNDCEEDCVAHLEVNECERVEVMIINCDPNTYVQEIQQDSPLRICKYIRRCDGCISKPEVGSQFKVMLIGCGRNEAFYLNAHNNFCVDIANLCNGEYEVREVGCQDYTTSYIINDGREKTSACICVDGCENICISIINEERNRGNLSVCKYIRNEFGDLIKPEKHQCFTITLSSYFYKECFVLDAENDWCLCFHDLRFGSYEVREDDCGEYQVSYLVNCERERNHARFMIDNCCDNEVKIINHVRKNPCGILKIRKYEETLNKEWVKPSRDEEFEIEVEGPCFCETYVLRASNNWAIMLEGLLEGEYHIRECDSGHYDVCYSVNREMMDEAIVYMGEYNQDVCVINRLRESGHVTLSAIVRNCDCEFERPSRNLVFDILLEGNEESFKASLCVSNDWCVELDHLPEGKYRIIQTDNLGYKVSYCIGGKEESFGRIELGCEDQAIQIINEETACTGVLKVTKYMEDEHGNLSMPCPQDEFHFELSGRCFCRTYTLRQRNDFCVYFDDLDEGTYEIKELDKEYDVHYCINGERCDYAKITLGREDAFVDIINEQSSCGLVSIEKRIRRGNTIVMPNREDCFQILLKGKNCHEMYELNASNDFCITLCDLCLQHYEVKEVGSDCAKMYEVNGNLQEDGYFLYEGDSVNITLINEEILYGSMELTKVIEDENGKCIRPSRREVFHVLVESDCFKQKITLCNENDFCARLYDLPLGHYEVKELDCEDAVSFMINGLPYESACVDVCEEDVCITIINHPCAKGCIQLVGLVEEDGCCRTPNEMDCFSVLICSDGFQEEVVLDCHNQFARHLCNLAPGSYTLRETSGCDITFEIDGHVFEDMVCIELDGEHVCVNVVAHKEHCADITITKCMVDGSGNTTYPQRGECFEVTLEHAGCTQSFELNRGNDWTKTLCEQAPGTYEIKEVDSDCDVEYQIDDGCASKKGCFELGKENVQVVIFNKMKCGGYVHLEAMVKDCDGELVMPCADMLFTMEITSCDFQKKVVLNRRNGWHQKVMVDAGTYTITQQEDACFKEQYYLIQDQKECQAVVEIDNCDQYITSVNVAKCAEGSIEVAKFIRNCSCDCLKRPSGEDEFEIEVRGENFHKIITLNAYNSWKEKLEDLPEGKVCLEEISGQCNVSYIVDGGKENSKAVVEVCNDLHVVKVINEEDVSSKGNIEICKLIKDEEGCYRYPNKEDSYWVGVTGEGNTSRVLLNYANHFYASIRNLKEGWYEVNEESAMPATQYIVNNATPSARGMVHVTGNSNTVNIINPCLCSSGSITLDKYVQSREGLLQKPMSGEYRIHVSKPGFNEVFTLSKKNDYHEVLQDLDDGLYVVDEVDHEHVSYIINGGTQLDYAVVEVASNANQVQIINAESPQDQGSITLAKYIRVNDTLMRPSGDESYVFLVSKPGFNQLYTLDRSNQWMLTIADLEDGDYVVSETTTMDSVTYIINGGSEQDRAVVSVQGNSNTVQIINTQRSSGGSIQLDKYVRNAMQEIVRPQPNFSTRIHISSPGYNEVITLNQANQWSYLLRNLAQGVYVVDEVDSMDQVTYIVNGGSEVNNAVVNVNQNTNAVQIINSSSTTGGIVELNKLIKNADGSLIRPVDGDVYTLEIYNERTQRRVQLNNGNDFTALITDLPSGTYNIRELNNENYTTTYRINGGAETSEPVLAVSPTSRYTVQVINEFSGNQNTIEVFKYMLDDSGNYLPPTAPDRYSFRITGDNVNQVYELNVDNQWHQSLTTLPSGVYQVAEIGTSPYAIQYLVNSEELKEEAIFTAQPGGTNVVGIINRITLRNQGKMMLSKRLRNQRGELVTPGIGESFTVRVTGNAFDRYVSLSKDNDFTYLLENLANGMYTLQEEENTYDVSYRINGGMESNAGRVNIQNGELNDVLIINTESGVFGNMSKASKPESLNTNNRIKIVIE